MSLPPLYKLSLTDPIDAGKRKNALQSATEGASRRTQKWKDVQPTNRDIDKATERLLEAFYQARPQGASRMDLLEWQEERERIKTKLATKMDEILSAVAADEARLHFQRLMNPLRRHEEIAFVWKFLTTLVIQEVASDRPEPLLKWSSLSEDKWTIISNASNRAYAALQEEEHQRVQPSDLLDNSNRSRNHLGRVVDDQPPKARKPGLAEIQRSDDSDTDKSSERASPARDQPITDQDDEVTAGDLWGSDSDHDSDDDLLGGF